MSSMVPVLLPWLSTLGLLLTPGINSQCANYCFFFLLQQGLGDEPSAKGLRVAGKFAHRNTCPAERTTLDSWMPFDED
ncbi:uncharacterized protein LOC131807412 isoform X8 [Mustela lutreola]|uniref:uncharacterized protein LOC131807412 isoform X8 n=1 Tax=Mustela lutreola TaxID=9666 RepID=UPI0027974218|nr:uncharacterized protein LOC131807412 isoform X8 [Mustela lutreola]